MFKGERLKELRKTKKLTQSELGEMLALDKSTICCYEKGTRQPSLENIIAFIQIFGVSADYFLGSDHLIKTIGNEEQEVVAMSKEEILFIKELRKDKTVYNILLNNPKRGAELIRHHIN